MDEFKNLNAFKKDLETLCRKHRVSLVVEEDETGLGLGVCLYPFPEYTNPDIVFFVDWWEHKSDSKSQLAKSRLRIVK